MLHQVRTGSRGFDDSPVGCEIASQHGNAPLLCQRLFNRSNDILIPVLHVTDILGDALTGNRQRIRMQFAPVQQALEDHRQPARIVEILHQMLPRRHQIDNGWNIPSQPVPVFQRQINTNAARNGQQMDDRIGGTANGAIGANGIFKGIAGQYIRGFEIILDHVHDAATGQLRHHPASAVNRRNGSIA